MFYQIHLCYIMQLSHDLYQRTQNLHQILATDLKCDVINMTVYHKQNILMVLLRTILSSDTQKPLLLFFPKRRRFVI